MRSVYIGNGFKIETNDAGELFISRAVMNAKVRLRLSTSQHFRDGIDLSYANQGTVVEPSEYRTFTFSSKES